MTSRRLAPGHPPDALDRGPPAYRHRGDHRVGPEHPLHPRQGSPSPVARRGVAAPEAELAPRGRHHHVGREPQQGQPAGDDVVEVVRTRLPGARLRGEPCFELPAHACHQRRGGQRAFVTPTAREPLAVLGLGFDDHLAARQAEVVEAPKEPVGEHLRRERGLRRLSSPVDRARRPPRARVAPARERDRAPTRRAARRCARAPVTPKRASTDASGRAAKSARVRRPRRVSRSTSAEPSSTRDASTVTDHGPRNPADSPRGTTSTGAARAGEGGREPAVGDADTRIGTTGFLRGREHACRERVVTTEIP